MSLSCKLLPCSSLLVFFFLKSPPLSCTSEILEPSCPVLPAILVLLVLCSVSPLLYWIFGARARDPVVDLVFHLLGANNITSLFWLEEPGQKPPCGSPSFQLKCNTNGAFLTHSIYQAYRVVSIFYHNNSVHVVDQNLPLATGCPAPTFNVSAGIGIFRPFVSSKANKELLFLGKCTGSSPAVSTGFHSLPCDNSSFVRLGDGRCFSSHRVQGGVPPGCLFTVVPILASPDANGDDYVASMKNGLPLEWTVVPGDCPKCMASGGRKSKFL